VLQPHPGSGQEDVLAVRSDGVDSPAATFHISRGGGLRTLAAPHVCDVPVVAAADGQGQRSVDRRPALAQTLTMLLMSY